MALPFFGQSQSRSKEEHWVPLSDLMTGLMMVFMLVAIVFMLQVEADAAKVKELKDEAERRASQMQQAALLYDRIRDQLYRDLAKEFAGDLPQWRAVLDRDLTIRFEEPEVLFETGEFKITPKFAEILAAFFPRYLSIIYGDSYRGAIEEVRIEGHTSTFWNAWTPLDQSYINNMKLSQDRTRSALEYILGLEPLTDRKKWLVGKLTANGLSSSRPRLRTDGVEDPKASQRVEFRLRTNAEEQIGEVLRAAQGP
jgi:outer membrane protein OmpA-like peptidoglycan-associated protein